jgi:hypothetical protein
LGIEEKLRGKLNDRVHEVRFDQPAPQATLAVELRRERPAREKNRSASVVGRVRKDVLYPGEIGIFVRRDAEKESRIGRAFLRSPIAHVEGGIGEHRISSQGRVKIAAQGVFRARTEIDSHAS